MKMKDVLFVPGLKKNILSISAMDAKGMRVAFVDGHEGCFCRWPRGLYKLKGHPEKALVHDTVERNELWQRRLAHVHYRALPLGRKDVEGLPEIQAKHVRNPCQSLSLLC